MAKAQVNFLLTVGSLHLKLCNLHCWSCDFCHMLF
ncbi:hypothetical protein GLYMA_03G073780v4 [Glycine max]|nr:hypothetical protein GLYMA_03G073780v4 [Glycine max]KAH1068975.1 hypothetical protein GYH30_006523 [Glycine max]